MAKSATYGAEELADKISTDKNQRDAIYVLHKLRQHL